MNKQDVIDAINNVIVANDQKGITAESLARVLLDMLEVTPESSGGVYYLQGVDGELTEEMKAANAIIYEKVKNNSLDGIITISSLGVSLPYSSAGYNEETDEIEVFFRIIGYLDDATGEFIETVLRLIISSDGSLKSSI